MPPLHKDSTINVDNTNEISFPGRGEGGEGRESDSRTIHNRQESAVAKASDSATTTPQALPSDWRFKDHKNVMIGDSSHDSAGSADEDVDGDVQSEDENRAINNPLLAADKSPNLPSSSSSTSSTSSSSLNFPSNDRSNGNAAWRHSRRDGFWMSKLPFFSRYLQQNWNETTVSGWRMMRFWLFGLITPLGVLTWTVTHHLSAVLASIFLLPTLAIMQGSFAIWRYRVQFGGSPLPIAPSHGIVKCRRKSSGSTGGGGGGGFSGSGASRSNGFAAAAGNPMDYGSSSHGSGLFSDGAAADNDDSGLLGASLSGTTLPHASSSNATPLRLLVIGDSLAIGVGQSKCATPIMPETIAKSLSKAMNGRPVLWTCHGAPGASAGWIVRELERSIHNGQFMQANPTGRSGGSCSSGLSGTSGRNMSDHEDNVDADSGSSSGDESSVGSGQAHPTVATTATSLSGQDDNEEEMKTWSDRLKEHKIRFDPNVLGPFDIAVVLTGSNDLKSAFFPFLLTGEDAEFRRQAQMRGGGYGNELTRILQVLNRRMRMRLQTLREQVEAASERVRESVDNIRERLGSHDFNAGDLNHIYGNNNGVVNASRRRAATLRRTASRNGSAADSDSLVSTSQRQSSPSIEATHLPADGDGIIDSTNHTLSSHGLHSSSLFPMVVLPGMPSRALPIFQTAPLRWLAIPIIDIMDSHKRKLARQHDGEVIFVGAPSVKDITDYCDRSGIYYQQETEDRILLQLRDIKRRHARRIESDMAKYFFKIAPPKGPESLPLRKRHFNMICVDGIHPNDEGYDFWGRYIANAIVEEWKRNQREHGVLDIV
jgi:hypothetical protein